MYIFNMHSLYITYMYMLQAWSWYWMPNWCALLWGGLFLQISTFLDCPLAWGHVSLPLSELACLLVPDLLLSPLGRHVSKTLWLWLLTFLGEIFSYQLSVPLTLRHLWLFSNDAWASDVGVGLQIYLLGLDSTTLHFAWLWLSIMDFICCKDGFSWWGMKTVLTCGCKDKYLKRRWELRWLGKVTVVGSPLRSILR